MNFAVSPESESPFASANLHGPITRRALIWQLDPPANDLEFIKQCLVANGFELTLATQVHEVESALDSQPGQDLVLIETGRGELARDRVVADLRASHLARSTPFLFLSPDGFTQAQVKRELAMGADDCIRIPEATRQDEFITRVLALLHRRRVDRSLLVVEPTTGLFAHRILETELDFQRDVTGSGQVAALLVVAISNTGPNSEPLDLVERREVVHAIADHLQHEELSQGIVFATERFHLLLTGATMAKVVEQARGLVSELDGLRIALEHRVVHVRVRGGLARLRSDQTNEALELEALRNLKERQILPSEDAELIDMAALIDRASEQSRIALLVSANENAVSRYTRELVANDVTVITASNLVEARSRLNHFAPDAVLLICPTLTEPIEEFLDFADARHGGRIPVLYVTDRQSFHDELIHGYQVGVDQVVSDPEPGVVAAYISSLIERPPTEDIESSIEGRLPIGVVHHSVELAGQRRNRIRSRGYLAVLTVPTLKELASIVGEHGVDQLRSQLVGVVESAANRPITLMSVKDELLLLSLPTLNSHEVADFLRELSIEIMQTTFYLEGERFRLTPAVGFCAIGAYSDPDEVVFEATEAALTAATNLDLQPLDYSYVDKLTRRAEKSAAVKSTSVSNRSKQLLEGIGPIVIPIFLPFLLYVWAYNHGFALAAYAYIVVVVALVLTAGTIILEGFLAIRPTDPPPLPEGDDLGTQVPKATALVAAYLPNEASTIVSTIENLLNNGYPNLEVVLAYNTPETLPIEAVLQELADQDARLVLLRVAQSTSKAQNVNAALEVVQGEFIGIFDADHQPMPGSFMRAWQWLGNGWDVVQGHSVIRNGSVNWITRMIAVEFEAIYAVSHPGRTRLHGFGLFGGSNGYWRTELLRNTRMHGFMLTEDIDSSIRVTENGFHIATDRELISTELAPTSAQALWDQRMRWAQGWFQVTLRHLKSVVVPGRLSLQQRFGIFMLLPFRELYLWISLQIFPIILFCLYRLGVGDIDWVIPVFLLTAIFTLSVGPAQTVFAYCLANPLIKRHKSWFWLYLALSTPWYTESKNQISRTAQAKEMLRDRKWKITPRD